MTDETKFDMTRPYYECAKCHTLIQSSHRHDMQFCECGAIAIDGGRDYAKYTFESPDVFIIHGINGIVMTLKDVHNAEEEKEIAALTGGKYDISSIAHMPPPEESDPAEVRLDVKEQKAGRKAILEFYLPEDNHDFELATKAGKMAKLLYEFDLYLRNMMKYQDKEDWKNAEEIRKEFNEMAIELGIDRIVGG